MVLPPPALLLVAVVIIVIVIIIITIFITIIISRFIPTYDRPKCVCRRGAVLSSST